VNPWVMTFCRLAGYRQFQRNKWPASYTPKMGDSIFLHNVCNNPAKLHLSISQTTTTLIFLEKGILTIRPKSSSFMLPEVSLSHVSQGLVSGPCLERDKPHRRPHFLNVGSNIIFNLRPDLPVNLFPSEFKTKLLYISLTSPFLLQALLISCTLIDYPNNI
jgi:hypothetical protein